jgi:tRNA-2-methylthio-N6-dimethylallyladenosine synthase
VTRKFLIRTFGCQMNEHDSERLAGMLEADGMESTDDLGAADVVVLNTCCIRENADNRLYGHLGHLKAEKDRRPDLQIAVGGCLAQKDRGMVQERAPQVDAVFGTHNLASAPELLRRAAREGPVMEILDAAQADDEAAFPSALPARRNLPYTAWVTIQVGCDNSCAFCIVPAVRGPEASRPFGQVVAEVEALARAGTSEVTLLGQNVNSYGRDLTSRLRAASADFASAVELAGVEWASALRPRARPLFADLLRAVGAVEGIRRVRFTSPHPKDLRPETIEAMATTPTVCPHLHLPLQAGSDRVLAAMHRGYTAGRYLARLAEARAAVPSSSASRGRPTTTSSAPSRWWPRPATTAPTRSSSRPGPAPRRRRSPIISFPPTWWPSASSGCGSSSSAPPSPATRPGWAGSRRCSSRARAARTPRSPPDAPARTSSCTSPAPTAPWPPAPTPGCG